MDTDNRNQITIPQDRIKEKVDEYMSRRDYPSVERMLSYWLGEAEMVQDVRGKLMVLNELIGHYRKTGEKEKAFSRIREAFDCLDNEGYALSITRAVTCINAATAYNSFDENEIAVTLFDTAREILESSKAAEDSVMGGLYNNLGLTLTALGRYKEAVDSFLRAIEFMSGDLNGRLNQAVSLLNLADTYCKAYGFQQAEKQIFGLLDQAEALFMDPSVEKNAYFAYVCSRSAPSFEYYGYFMTAETLNRTAREIYERT